MARKLLRLADSFTPTESQEVRRPMPLGTTLAGYVIRLTGTLTVGVAAATVLEDSPYGFIRNMAVILNGSFPLQSADARFYFFSNRQMHGTPPRVTAPAGAVGASNFVAEFRIPFSQYDLQPPLDSAWWLDTRLLNRLELVYNFGAAVDVATAGGGGTVALSNLAIRVFAEEIADVGGPASRMQVARSQQQITATGDLDLQIPALGQAYRGIALHFTSGNADPIRATSDDTIMNTYSLIGDNVVRHYDATPYETMRSDSKTLYHVEVWPAGWVFIDYARSKTLRDILITSKTRQLIQRLNIAAAPANTFVQFYPLNALILVRAGMRRNGGRAA